MKVNVRKEELLTTLQANRTNHRKIVEEARAGYVDRAKTVLEAKLGRLREGKIVSLTFNLSPPQDHTGVYDTAIQMLELHQGELLELSAGEVRSLVMDEWDWLSTFLIGNSAYSGSARAYASSKGVLIGAQDDDLVGGAY